MSLDKIKARLGALSPAKLEEIKGISSGAYNLIRDMPLLINVAEVAYEVDCCPSPINIRDLTEALDKLDRGMD